MCLYCSSVKRLVEYTYNPQANNNEIQTTYCFELICSFDFPPDYKRLLSTNLTVRDVLWCSLLIRWETLDSPGSGVQFSSKQSSCFSLLLQIFQQCKNINNSPRWYVFRIWNSGLWSKCLSIQVHLCKWFSWRQLMELETGYRDRDIS